MESLSGRPTSYWMDSTSATAYPSLTESPRTEVALIGAGIAGICAAWEIARTGRQVVLLEADRVAAGTTGHTTAKLTAAHTGVYHHLRSTFGQDTARQYAQSQLDAVEHVATVSAELGIDCELERLPAYTYVTEPDQVGQIEAEVAAARESGLAASLVTETGLPFPVAAAIRVENQAQFHPRRFLLALVADLLRRGGQVFEHCRVTGLDEGDPHRLTTATGQTVTADHVVVATHYPIFDRAGLFARLSPHRELVVAAPIPAGQDPHGMYLTTEENTRSVRTAPYRDGQRLLIVTGESFTPGTGSVTERWRRLADWTEARFAVRSPTYRWAAQDNDTTDRLPYIGQLRPGGERVWVATGFGGWGMSNGVLAGKLIAARIDGTPPSWSDLFDPRRLRPTAEAGTFLRANAEVAKHFVGDRLHRAGHADTLAQLPPGGGAIVRLDGARCAVHRDADGTLRAVSATCTHLGCLVAFNDAEQSWDCPCHGSRFAPDGTVLHGPATRPLEPRDLPTT
ncbi:FAD-dependent oxidoreductase [Solwaraspora sp. WMMD406]|uniref:FAD-dependent oxidoreductase n=1 Tax=Solwaraspora sp. WMMD406 TaxID=3016095 RepID=UPI002416844B|nr:FAD-dependent oxidoreductase [Solwaraspora sp. WMMD406]MDG4764547.1 FAD-dependent oxidoreductase [Solwaraspora sp. WMMD406]